MEPTDAAVIATDNHQHSAPLLLSAETVAELLGISIRTLWRLRAAGRLPRPVRLGGSVRWRPEDIQAWIADGCPETQR